MDRKSEELVQLLLERGADATVQDSVGRSYLFDAVINDLPGAITSLAVYGADVNAKVSLLL